MTFTVNIEVEVEVRDSAPKPEQTAAETALAAIFEDGDGVATVTDEEGAPSRWTYHKPEMQVDVRAAMLPQQTVREVTR